MRCTVLFVDIRECQSQSIDCYLAFMCVTHAEMFSLLMNEVQQLFIFEKKRGK